MFVALARKVKFLFRTLSSKPFSYRRKPFFYRTVNLVPYTMDRVVINRAPHTLHRFL